METLIITLSHKNGASYRMSLLAFVVLAAEFFISMGHTNTHRVLWLQKFTITCATFLGNSLLKLQANYSKD